MVCLRCKLAVKDVLTTLGIPWTQVELGQAELAKELSNEMQQQLKASLLRSGLELLQDKKAVLIQKIKNVIVELVHYAEEPLLVNLSDHLAERLQHDYTYLSNLFSEVQGITIEHFFILHRIERVKELLVYNELSLTQIARQMHYSSVAHLSNQFKKVTGLTPSGFKQMKHQRRSMLDDL